MKPTTQAPASTDDELLTSSEVADRFRVSLTTVTRWARTGEVPAIRIGKVLRFRRSDIEQALTPKAAS